MKSGSRISSTGFDIISIYAFFMLAMIVIYRVPGVIALTFFIGIAVYIYISKNMYLMYGVLLLFFDSPGDILTEGSASYLYGLPFISIAPGTSIGTIDLFLIVLIIMNKRQHDWNYLYKKVVAIFVAHGILVFLYSQFLGMSLTYAVLLGRLAMAYYALYPFVGGLFSSEESIERITDITIGVFVLAFANQIAELVLRTSITTLIAGNAGHLSLNEVKFNEQFLGGVRILSSIYVNFICTTLVMRRLLNNRYTTKDILVLVLAYVSILLTATRGWFIAYTVMYLILLVRITASYNISRSLQTLILVLVGVILMSGVDVVSGGIIRRQMDGAIRRIMTLEDIVKGDLEAQGTVGRLTYTSDEVLEHWKRNPILGWGFSSLNRANIHVGNQNILQTYGLIGFIILYWMAGYYLMINIKYYSSYSSEDSFACVIGFVGVMIIHSSSRQMLGYDTYTAQRIVIMIFLVLLALSNHAARKIRMSNIQSMIRR